jgi:hypothetical protein
LSTHPASFWNVLGGGLAAFGAMLAFVSFVMMVRRLQNTGGVRNRSIFDGVQGRTRAEWTVIWTSRALFCVGLILMVI